MSQLDFKGKEFVFNHHLSVPFRPLVMDAGRGVGEPSLAGNLIIHGDNLHALKALLPFYAGRWTASSSTRRTTPATSAGATTTT